MIRKFIFFALTILLTAPVMAKEIGGVEFPESRTVNEQDLTLNGVGARKKFFIKVYVAGLYLTNKSSDSTAIIESNDTMSLSLEIVSGLVDKDKMTKAIVEGFDNATGGDTAAIQPKIDQFVAILQEGVEKQDRFDFDYIADTGIIISKNGEEKATIEGHDFKQALFGIWLADKPAQKSLKSNLLGQ